MSNEAIKAYLMARVTQGPGAGDCWLWTLALGRGYGLCWINGRDERAARASYRAWVGPIPPGHDIHHTCPNRHCINPAHLEPMAHGAHLRLHATSGAWAGEKNSQAKLTETDVQIIKMLGNLVPAKDLAGAFDIAERTVYHNRSERAWPHVRPPTFPPRSLPEILQDGRGAIHKGRNMLLKIRDDCQELGEPEPPSLAPALALAEIALSIGI